MNKIKLKMDQKDFRGKNLGDNVTFEKENLKKNINNNKQIKNQNVILKDLTNKNSQNQVSFQNLNHYSCKLKDNFSKIDDNKNLENSNYSNKINYDTKNKTDLLNYISNTMNSSSNKTGSMLKKPPKGYDIQAKAANEKQKCETNENVFPKAAHFTSNNTHKTTNFSDLENEKSETIKFTSTQNKNFNSFNNINMTQNTDINNYNTNTTYNYSSNNSKLNSAQQKNYIFKSEKKNEGTESNEKNFPIKNNYLSDEKNISKNSLNSRNSNHQINEKNNLLMDEKLLTNKIQEIKIFLKKELSEKSEKTSEFGESVFSNLEINRITSNDTTGKKRKRNDRRNSQNSEQFEESVDNDNDLNQKYQTIKDYESHRSKSNSDAILQVKNEIINSLKNSNFNPDYIQTYKSKKDLKYNNNNINHYTSNNKKNIKTNINTLDSKTQTNSMNIKCAFENIINEEEEDKLKNSILSNGEINLEDKFKNNLVSNLKLLYDKDSQRSKKRSEQIKRIKSSRSVSVDNDFYERTSENNSTREKFKDDFLNISKIQKNFEEDEKNGNFSNFFNKTNLENSDISTYNLIYLNTNNVNSKDCTFKEKNKNDDKSQKDKNSNTANLNVSDLNASIDQTGEDVNNNCLGNDCNIQILKNINNKNIGFVKMKNNLKNKSDLGENLTESYMMALTGCNDKQENEEEENYEIEILNSNNSNTSNNSKNLKGNKLGILGHLEKNCNILSDNYSTNNQEEENHVKEYLILENEQKKYNQRTEERNSKPQIPNPINNIRIADNLVYHFDEANMESSKTLQNSHRRASHLIPDNNQTQNNQQNLPINHNRSKSQDINNFRLPSGRKYMVNSVIIEEISENYTDSEFSNKKKSFLFSKSKLESSEKIIQGSNRGSKEYRESSHFNIIEKNLEKEIFNKMKNNKYSKYDLIYVENLPIVDEKNQDKNTIETLSKSELFNLQLDIKATFKEIKNKKFNEELNSKMTKENKKKEILEKFYNKKMSSDSKSESNQYISITEKKISDSDKVYKLNTNINNTTIPKFNLINHISKYEPGQNNQTNLYYEKNKNFGSDSKTNNPNLVLNINQNKGFTSATTNLIISANKKSPSSIKREKYYEDNVHYDISNISKNLNAMNYNLNNSNVSNNITVIQNKDNLNLTNKISNNSNNISNNMNNTVVNTNLYFNSNKNQITENEDINMNMIDANINISLNNSFENNHNMNNNVNTNLKLNIESKGNSPIRMLSNRDFDDTMNVITESSLRNYNLIYNNSNNNFNNNLNHLNSTGINNNSNSLVNYANNTTFLKNIREKYKKERKKNNSTIFKSDDFRMSKVDNVNIPNIINTNPNLSSNNTNNTFLYNQNNNMTIKNNLNTNSISEDINTNNNMNVCSPISSYSQTKNKMYFNNDNTANSLINEKKEIVDNRLFAQYDSRGEATYNGFAGVLTPSRQNSFNLNFFVSRNESQGLINLNLINNNINSNNHQNHYNRKPVDDSNISYNNVVNNLSSHENYNDNSTCNNINFNHNFSNINSNNHLILPYKNKLNIDKNSEVIYIESNRKNCLIYKSNTLSRVKEIDIQFLYEIKRHKKNLVKSKSGEIFIRSSRGSSSNNILIEETQNKSKNYPGTKLMSYTNCNINHNLTNFSSRNNTIKNHSHNNSIFNTVIQEEKKAKIKEEKSNSNIDLENDFNSYANRFNNNNNNTYREKEKNFFVKHLTKEKKKNPINLIYGNPDTNTFNNYSNNIYQNYNKTKGISYKATASAFIGKNNRVLGYSNSNFHNNQTDVRGEKNGSESKSLSSSIIGNNQTINANNTINSNYQINNFYMNTFTNNSNYISNKPLNKISPLRPNFQTIDNNTNFLVNNINNNQSNSNNTRLTPLLADIKKYQEKLYSKTLLYKKLNNNNQNIIKNKIPQKNNQNESDFPNSSQNNKKITNNSIGKNKNNFYKMLHNSSKYSDGESPINTIRPTSSMIINIKNNGSQINVKENLETIKSLDEQNYINEKMKNSINTNKLNGSKPNKTHEKKKRIVFLPNVDSIVKTLKYIKFPKNYIDFYKMSLEKLQNSRGDKFLISVFEDKRNYEFKGLYQYDEIKGLLNLIYCASYSENQINFSNINKFFKFSKDTKTFKEEKTFSKDCLLFII